jgi:hypothetical protein
MANDGTQRMRSHTLATTPDGPEASLQQNAIQNPTRYMKTEKFSAENK